MDSVLFLFWLSCSRMWYGWEIQINEKSVCVIHYYSVYLAGFFFIKSMQTTFCYGKVFHQGTEAFLFAKSRPNTAFGGFSSHLLHSVSLLVDKSLSNSLQLTQKLQSIQSNSKRNQLEIHRQLCTAPRILHQTWHMTVLSFIHGYQFVIPLN